MAISIDKTANFSSVLPSVRLSIQLVRKNECRMYCNWQLPLINSRLFGYVAERL